MRLFLAVLAAAVLLVSPAEAGQQRPDPAAALLAAFDSHAIVAKSSPDVGRSCSTWSATRGFRPG